jgi:hypothetical protein
MEHVVARQTWRTLEPIHGMVYFAQEPKDCYAQIGVTNDRMGYFASRSAPMGAVPADVVIATFFNFNPELVRHVIPAAWGITSPEQILAARLEGVDRALQRTLGDAVSGGEMKEAADLARQAAEVATEHPEGRALFAGHAELPWPDEAHLVLWHAQSLLREFRGDAHVAALLLDGLTGIEALVIHGATGEVPPSTLQTSRAWPDDKWTEAVEGLHRKGWVTADGTALTDEGREHRQWVEDRTDALSVAAYETLGEEGCSRLRQLARPISKAIVEGGLLGGR